MKSSDGMDDKITEGSAPNLNRERMIKKAAGFQQELSDIEY